FQAEDGIRDFHVTGVQTCALPIFNNGEYKVMGMAPYGEPRYVDKVKQLITLNGDGSFELNMDYFSFHHSATRRFNGRFTDLFGRSEERRGGKEVGRRWWRCVVQER